MRKLENLCLEMGDLRLKLSANAQCSLSGQTLVFLTEVFNLGTDESIIRNGVLSDDKKVQILNAKASIKEKRSIIKKEKKERGILFDKRSSEENLFSSCTKSEHNILDANIMVSMREKAYRMYHLEMNVTEMEQDTPKKVQYVLYSVECTKTGISNRRTLAIANIERNYVQISDFVSLKDTDEVKVYGILTTMFNKYSLLKKECENWTEIANKIQDNLKEYSNSDFKTVMYWIENNLD